MTTDANAPSKTKPVIALMGEFSAGKSTLCNLLIGAQPLPTKVTSTNLPPIWVRHGDQAAEAVDIHGETQPADLSELAEIDPATTQYLRISQRSKVLELCDLIDMPGISDPNMPAEVWQRVIGFADAVIWCTPASQAWRQSEAAVWDSFPQEIRDRSILLVTRFDKILSKKDGERVMHRVRQATDGQFGYVYPISLLEAMDARNVPEKWANSGAKLFAEALIRTVAQIKADLIQTQAALPSEPEPRSIAAPEPDPAPEAAPEPTHAAPRYDEMAPPAEAEAPIDANGPRVLPRRVRAAPKTRRILQRRPKSVQPEA